MFPLPEVNAYVADNAQHLDLKMNELIAIEKIAQ
jgi:hypothetical protein